MELFAIWFVLSVGIIFMLLILGSFELIFNKHTSWWRWLAVVVFWLVMAAVSLYCFSYMEGFSPKP